jgi:hypothetical protein
MQSALGGRLVGDAGAAQAAADQRSAVHFPGHVANVSMPSFNPRSIDGRVVPDICALAGRPLHDLLVFGRDNPNGGTSVSAR